VNSTEKHLLELRNLFAIENGSLRGKSGEAYIANLLKNLDYLILHQNLKTPYGELDLIFQKNKILYICEVKTRSGKKEFHPISSGQKRRLKLAATWIWQKYHTKFESIRGCLIIVTRRGIKWKNLSLLYDHT
jgi:Holliday junction resolvase-like predicted endonuclease